MCKDWVDNLWKMAETAIGHGRARFPKIGLIIILNHYHFHYGEEPLEK